jgi:hypothetical protein
LRSRFGEARKEYEEALKNVPQEEQPLVRKWAEKQVRSALKEFQEGQQESNRLSIKQRIEAATFWLRERSLFLKERPRAIKEIYEINKEIKEIKHYFKQKITFISEDIKALFKEKLECCIEKFNKSYLQTKWSYKTQSGARWREDWKKNEQKMKQCLSEFQEMKKDLDQLWSLEEARKEHEKALYYVPQKYQFLVRKLAETRVDPALKEYNLVLQGKQQGCDRLHARACIEEASRWLKERSERYKKPIEDLIEKIENVGDDKMTHVNDIKSILEEISEKFSKHDENTLKDQIKKIIDNLNNELNFIEGSKNIKETLEVICRKCPDEPYKESIEGSIAMVDVMLDHRPTSTIIDLLKGTHQHVLQQFYKDCNGETKPPTKTIDQWTQHFKETYAQMAEARAYYQRVESDSNVIDHTIQLMQSLTKDPITSEWEKCCASYNALVICIGDVFEKMNPYIHQQMLTYNKKMESHKKLKEILDEKLKKQESVLANARQSKVDLATAGRSKSDIVTTRQSKVDLATAGRSKSDITISSIEQFIATLEIQSSATRTNIKKLIGDMKKTHKNFEDYLRYQGWLEKDVSSNMSVSHPSRPRVDIASTSDS